MKFILLLFLAILPSLAFGKISFENKEIEITAAADQEKVTFVFGNNLDINSKKSINVAISELLSKGRIIFLERKWND